MLEYGSLDIRSVSWKPCKKTEKAYRPNSQTPKLPNSKKFWTLGQERMCGMGVDTIGSSRFSGERRKNRGYFVVIEKKVVTLQPVCVV